MPTFPQRLRDVRREREVMAKTVAELLGIGYRNYQRYETGEVDPPTSKLLILADYFNVSTDYLLCRTNVPEVNHRSPQSKKPKA